MKYYRPTHINCRGLLPDSVFVDNKQFFEKNLPSVIIVIIAWSVIFFEFLEL